MTIRWIVGVFQKEDDLYHATVEAREKKIPIFDAYTPYPVHGLEDAMGLAPTRLGVVCFIFGLTGLLCALLLQSWITTVSWPLNIGGKSFWALPALMPVTFEVTILFAALGTVLTLLIRTKLWPGKKPRFATLGTSDDRFILVLDSVAERAAEIREILKKAETVQELEENTV